LIATVGEALARQLQACFTLIIGIAIGLNASWQVALVTISTFPLNIFASVVHNAAMLQK
jgi:ABC-type multidrug transport system fused ATPase/permease subunit